MLIRRPGAIPSSEMTDEQVYVHRREFMRLAAGAALAAAAGSVGACGDGMSAVASEPSTPGQALTPLENVKPKVVTTDEKLNSFEEISSYNNFYEFGTRKRPIRAPIRGPLQDQAWKVKIDGLCAKPADYDLEDLIKPHPLEERIYRLRCVEAWSMVIPWVGIPLARCHQAGASRIGKREVRRVHDAATTRRDAGTARARPRMAIRRGTAHGRSDAPAARFWRSGCTERRLPNQNGAPIRLVVPWKYGFKSIKSIVRIRFVEQQPQTAWSVANSREYGFYSNVNPEVDHPRWSQAREKRLPSLFATTLTQMFNGYGDQVASMYAGMDLRRNY